MPPPRGTPNFLEGPGDYDVTPLVHSDTYDAINPLTLDLRGCAVFISGGSKGLGRGMALSFAKAGASYIAVGARSEMAQLAEDVAAAATSANRPAPKFLPIKTDVTDQQSVDAAAEKVKSEFGRCDILINNAGILGTLAPVTESDPAHWWHIMETNLRGSYLLSRAFVPLLLSSDGRSKTVITVSSVGAHLLTPGGSAYQISKLGLLRLSQFLDTEYANQGLVSICIHPGNSPTGIIGNPKNAPDNLLNSMSSLENHSICDIECEMAVYEQRMLTLLVLTDTPELCGDTVAYLASKRREWLSGRYVNVTWDMPQLLEKKEEIEEGDKLKIKFIF